MTRIMMRFSLRAAVLCALVACGDSDPEADAGSADATADVGGMDADTDAATDAATDTSADSAPDVPADALVDSQTDTRLPDTGALSSPQAAFLWQGFDHEWLRNVAGFRVPHRVSRLDSAVTEVFSRTDGEGAAQTAFAQSTGVDGNYMDPQMRWGALSSAGLFVDHGEVTTRFTDDGSGGEYPRAMSSREMMIEVALPTGVDQAHAVLRGFQLESVCDPALQPAGEPCNSNGFWPYRMSVGIAACTTSGGSATCAVTVEIGRAWTPNRGGIRGIEEKPFNDKLTYDITVLYSVIGGGADVLAATASEAIVANAPARNNDPQVVSSVLAGARGVAGAVGLTRFGFTFLRTGAADARQHLGRYIGRLNFGIEPGEYDPASGAIEVDHIMQVWIPDTVVATDVDYEMRSVLLVLKDADSRALAGQVADGEICRNSAPEAPLFSRWNRCGGGDFGPEQVEDTSTVSTAGRW